MNLSLGLVSILWGEPATLHRSDLYEWDTVPFCRWSKLREPEWSQIPILAQRPPILSCHPPFLLWFQKFVAAPEWQRCQVQVEMNMDWDVGGQMSVLRSQLPLLSPSEWP